LSIKIWKDRGKLLNCRLHFKKLLSHEANANRIKGLESTIAVLLKPTPLPEYPKSMGKNNN
jgi:hypothetical protein